MVNKTDGICLSKDLDMVRVGLSVPGLRIADIDYNVTAIESAIQQAYQQHVQILAFPEMSLTGYTVGDLVHHQVLLSGAVDGLARIVKSSAGQTSMLIIVGMPLLVEQKVYNCAVLVNSGRILGIVPKTFIPTYKEFYEERWWSSSSESRTDTVALAGQQVPFGPDLLFRLNNSTAVVGIEICEDLWAPLAPHESQSLGGATILVNISASNEVLGKKDWRRVMIASESGRCSAAYCYTSAGIGESSNDVVFSGHAIIAENGNIIKESRTLSAEPQLIVNDIDIGRLVHDRRVNSSFRDVAVQAPVYRTVDIEINDPPAHPLYHCLDAHPFVPSDPAVRTERCREIFALQVAALAQKMQGARQERLVVGVSGGLDSTLALLVAVKTMDFLKLPRQNVYAFTMPGFGTTTRTRSNATRLSESLGVHLEKVSIMRSAAAHLKDLAHDGDGDVVFENVQARYRTEFLFNKANQVKGILLGTGDLTEIALGWSTFSGDHMSHYDVNASVPKTLIQYLIRWVAEEELKGTPASRILHDVLVTPISPELQRPKNGRIVQKSEDIIGPVELADFFLYPFIRFGMPPGKILFFASETVESGLFDQQYTLDDLHKWFSSFLHRFFTNQFKRTCLPEGPKVGSVSLSPRGDWRMPSEAEAKLWLEDLAAMYQRLK
jgi:NAD+ synthase (glutamine-hydrolysing)